MTSPTPKRAQNWVSTPPGNPARPRLSAAGDLLHRVGEMSFPHRTGRGDGAKHAGSPDRGDAGWKPEPRNCYWPPHAEGMDPEDGVRFKSHDFR
ncbi:hypothetical protein NHF48_002300 [Sphingomonas sp. H160509]|uniref:hypothetical protein n=1 Tax=Sphingomonas sp. H160509 TaxID=2955313 RepID=UPI00209755B8|nr:hypothetical protein [Sphingomonas sp. H160509]MDD1450047.1 hypothetical protein [Sphingomonas sp. H160509]